MIPVYSTGLVFITALCWGSFLNVIAYSLLHNKDWIKRRSACPQCAAPLAWYDLIPVISWLALRARCRSCKQPISPLYLFIELASGITFTLLWLYAPEYFWAYIPLFSALLITVRTDLESMLVFRTVIGGATLLGLFLSALNLLPVSLTESILALGMGYGILWLTRKLFWLYAKKEGLGEGDLDILALIGAYTGPLGVWGTLFIASFTGSFISIAYMLATQQKNMRTTPIPFGPFLALGALITVLFQAHIQHFLFNF